MSGKKHEPIEITIDQDWVEQEIKEEREAKARFDEVMKDVPDDPDAVMGALFANFDKIFKGKP